MGQIGSWIQPFGGGPMNLDVNTLFLVTIYVEAILGLLLLFAWVQNAGIRAVAWWGSAHIMRAGSVVLFGMYGSVSEAITIDLANALLFLAYGITWTGARVFDGRKPLPVYLVAGPVVWGGVCHLASFSRAPALGLLVASGLLPPHPWPTALTLLPGPAEPAGW